METKAIQCTLNIITIYIYISHSNYIHVLTSQIFVAYVICYYKYKFNYVITLKWCFHDNILLCILMFLYYYALL